MADIAPSTRPDGSIRTPRKVRPGWVPFEERVAAGSSAERLVEILSDPLERDLAEKTLRKILQREREEEDAEDEFRRTLSIEVGQQSSTDRRTTFSAIIDSHIVSSTVGNFEWKWPVCAICMESTGTIRCNASGAAAAHRFCTDCAQTYIVGALRPNDGRGGLGGEALRQQRDPAGQVFSALGCIPCPVYPGADGCCANLAPEALAAAHGVRGNAVAELLGRLQCAVERAAPADAPEKAAVASAVPGSTATAALQAQVEAKLLQGQSVP
eukprot:SAG11_NODE_7203_length_1178_cov_1.544949_2_plen_268_part_01